MFKKIFVSIIIPHYNRPDFLLSCLDSIVANNYPQKNYEVIVVDDCSTDNIDSIINYSKIKNYHFFQLEVNSGGASIPRNFALGRARGEYILFIDSDDSISPGFLAKTVALAKRGNCDVVNVPKETERTEITSLTKNFSMFEKDTIVKISDEHKYGWPFFLDRMIHGRLLRRSLIQKFNIKFPESIKKSEDRCFNRVFWSVAKTAGICVSERYNLSLHDETNQLHKYTVTVDDEFNMLAYLLPNIIPIPNKYASINKKAVVFNRWFKSDYLDQLLQSPHHLAILKTNYGQYFDYLYNSGKLVEKAMPIIHALGGIEA